MLLAIRSCVQARSRLLIPNWCGLQALWVRTGHARQDQPRHILAERQGLADLDNLPKPEGLAEEIIENLEAGLTSLAAVVTSLSANPGVFRLTSVPAVSLTTIAPAIGTTSVFSFFVFGDIDQHVLPFPPEQRKDVTGIAPK